MIMTCVNTRLRSWHPGMVMGLVDLPAGVQEMLGNSLTSSVVVKRFIIDDFKVVKSDRIQALGENRVDKFRAAVSEEIGVVYDVALVTQSGDI